MVCGKISAAVYKTIKYLQSLHFSALSRYPQGSIKYHRGECSKKTLASKNQGQIQMQRWNVVSQWEIGTGMPRHQQVECQTTKMHK
jgi:hypothetical protein